MTDENKNDIQNIPESKPSNARAGWVLAFFMVMLVGLIIVEIYTKN